MLRQIYLLLFVLLGTCFAAQAQSTEVEYDFDDSSKFLNAVLPFDDPFTIRFTNIDPNVNGIVLRFYMLENVNYRKLVKSIRDKNQGNPEISNDQVLNYAKKNIVNFVYRPDSLLRGINFAGSSGTLQVIFPLRPSSTYLAEVLTYELKPLTDTEKDELTTAVLNDPVIEQKMNVLANKYASGITKGNESINAFAYQLEDYLKKSVTQVDADYVLDDFDLANYLLPLSNMFTDIANLVEADLATLKENIQNDSLFKVKDSQGLVFARINEHIDDLKRKYQQAQWLRINPSSDDEKLKDFQAVLEEIKKELKIAPQLLNELEISFANFPKTINSVLQQKNVFLEQVRKQIAAIVVANCRKQGHISKTYPKGFAEYSKQFLTSDIGLAYVGGLDRVHPYAAANIYFRPINDSLPLRRYKGLGNVLANRTSLLLGISVDNINKDSVRQGLILNSQALVTGIGFRVIPWLKINAGAFLYYRKEFNPLLSRQRLIFTGSPFVSLSIDLRLRSFFGSIGPQLFRN